MRKRKVREKPALETVKQEYRNVAVGEIKPHPKNPNHGSVQAIKKSIAFNGFYGAVIVQKATGYIIAGNHRYQAAVDSGAKEIPAIVIDCDDERAAAIMIADNQTTKSAFFDDAELKAVLEGLDEAARVATMLDDHEIARILRVGTKTGPTKAAGKTDNIQVKSGDVFRVAGRHALICSDSTKAAGLLAKHRLPESFDLVCTDPPYELDGGTVVGVVSRFSRQAVILCADKQAYEIDRVWPVRFQLVAVRKKPRKVPSLRIPLMKHNLIVICADPRITTAIWRKPNPSFSSVVEEESLEGAGWAKSPRLPEIMLEGFAAKTVCDPFGGTGSTLVAAHASGRDCVCIEKDPAQAKRALERFVDAGLDFARMPS